MNSLLNFFSPDSLLEFVRLYLLDSYASKTYSQEGEDAILNRVFEGKNVGFFIDVGAHHPRRFSNTYFFYKKGWSGINIDAMPGSMKLFEKTRPRDINIESPVGLGENELTYYVFNEPALNGFDSFLSESRHKSPDKYKILKTIDLKVRTLESILDVSMPAGVEIDFLTVDVEGLDLDVLKSNNWNIYRPRFVLAEILNCSLDMLYHSAVTQFLGDNGYKVYAKTLNTVIFKSVD